MTTTDTAALARYLDMFPAWLRTLGEDAGALGGVVGGDGNEEVRRYVASGLNYIFKSLDLIPDGIDDLGFCDDAFVIRVAAALAVEAEPAAAEGVVGRLAEEAKSVEDFLGDDYARLVTYVKGLRKGAARGRTECCRTSRRVTHITRPEPPPIRTRFRRATLQSRSLSQRARR